jgi:PAN domain
MSAPVRMSATSTATRNCSAAGRSFCRAELLQERLKEEVEPQTKAVADVETRLKAAEAEQQRLREEVQHQGKAAVDLVPKLNAAEAEQQQLIQRQAKAAAEAEAVEAEQQRLATKVQTRFSASGFTIRTNTAITGLSSDAYSTSVASISDCEQKCARSQSCKAFAYNTSNRMCYTYRQQFDTQIQVFALFVGDWGSSANQTRATRLQQFVGDMLNSEYMDILSQYGCGTSGSLVNSVFIPSTDYEDRRHAACPV